MIRWINIVSLILFSSLYSVFATSAEVIRVDGTRVFIKYDQNERLPIGEIFEVQGIDGGLRGRIQIINSRGSAFEAKVLSGQVNRGDYFQGIQFEDPEEFVSAISEADKVKRINYFLDQNMRFLIKPLPLFIDAGDFHFDFRITNSFALGIYAEYQALAEDVEESGTKGSAQIDLIGAGLSLTYGFSGAINNGIFTRIRGGLLQANVSVSDDYATVKADSDATALALLEDESDTFPYGYLDFGYQSLVGHLAFTAYLYATLISQEDLEPIAEIFSEGESYLKTGTGFGLQLGYAF
tara:strand:+ start:748 stop:1632 length:885 start_codon:yes stop_codon:yes gene_type:complete